MSAEFTQIITSFFSNIWTIMTSFKIPLVNFSPATMMFGILSFGLAIKFIFGILNITTTGLSDKVVKEHNAKVREARKKQK